MLDLDAAFEDGADIDELPDNSSSEDAGAGPADTSTGYGAAAPTYWARGWRSILPLPRGQKFPPPTGYTGDGASAPSYADIFAWCEDHATGNLALAMPDGVVGIDVDAYDAKQGSATLAAAEAAWGELPPTVLSTSRADGVSGIRLYRVPPGTRLQGQLTMDGTSDVEIVQRHHRYVLAHPSVHPTTGGLYRWLDVDGSEISIPAVDDLAMLPDRWVTELRAATVPLTNGQSVDVPAILSTLPDGAPDAAVSKRLNQALTDLQVGGSRHDSTVKHVLALLRLAEQDHQGVRDALDVLYKAFVDAVAGDGRAFGAARAEFKRMLTNPRGHDLIAATPTIDFAELDELGDLVEAGPASPPPPPPAGGGAGAEPESDDEFWESRDSLRAVRDAARNRMAAPWGVLGATVTRVICTVPHTVTLPALIGGRGSLNFFAALVGPSGAGKGAAEAVARELVPHGPEIGSVEVGSGEGLAHQFVRRATPVERATKQAEIDGNGMIWLRRSVALGVAEVDTLGALGQRSSATLMSKLRNAWSGEELGFGYATADKALTTGAHGYRLAMTVGVQAERAGALLADSAGGTPQRFIWMPVTDPAIARRTGGPVAIAPLALPSAWPTDPWTMPVPAVAADTVLDAHVARMRGEGDALDGHALFTRLKVMAALCVIDGRIEPNEEDWQLADAVMVRSDVTRQAVADDLAAAERTSAAERGSVLGVERDAAEGSAYEAKLNRVCAVILRGVARLEAAGKPATEARISRLIAGRDRSMKGDAMEALILRGALTRDSATGSFSVSAGGDAAAR